MLATPKVGIWEHSKCKLSSSVSEHEDKKMWYGQLLILKISIIKKKEKKADMLCTQSGYFCGKCF